MTRSEYLKGFLISRGVNEQSLCVRELAYNEVIRMSSYEAEFHQLVNRANYNAALELSPQEKQQRRDFWAAHKASSLIQRTKNRQLTVQEVEQFTTVMNEMLRLYPVVLDCVDNGNIVGKAIGDRNINFLDRTSMERLVTDLIAEQKLWLNPAALGPEYEDRYGDELSPGNQNITATDLKKFTKPNRPQSERERIESMSADEFYRSEHGKPLREERNRRADGYIREQEFQKGEAEVNLFLMSQRDYARTDDNRVQMLNYLEKNNLSLTHANLSIAFSALKHQLALTGDNNAEFGMTRVIDYKDLRDDQTPKLPATRITLQDIRKMSASDYANAMNNRSLRNQIEALLK